MRVYLNRERVKIVLWFSACAGLHSAVSRGENNPHSVICSATALAMSWRAYCVLLFVCFPGSLSAPTQWPYHQIYPPVNESDDRTSLYFALVLSFGSEVTYKSIGALPGVQIALDYINSQPSILPGYTLHYTLTDSQVAIHRLNTSQSCSY